MLPGGFRHRFQMLLVRRRVGRRLFGPHPEHLVRRDSLRGVLLYALDQARSELGIADRPEATFEAHPAQLAPAITPRGQQTLEAKYKTGTARLRHRGDVEAARTQAGEILGVLAARLRIHRGAEAEQHPAPTRRREIAQQLRRELELREVENVLHQCASRAHDFCDLEQLRGIGVRSRNRSAIGQNMRREAVGRETHRAGVDRLRHDLGHLLLLGFGRLFFDRSLAHDVEANGTMAHESGHVETGVEALDRVEIAAVIFPIPREAVQNRVLRDVLDRLHHTREEFPVGRLAGRERHATVSHHDRRHAVPTHRRAMGIPTDLRIQMRVNVDEAGCDDVTVRIDLAAASLVDVADGRDDAVVDSKVAGDGICARAVHDLSATNYDVMCHSDRRFSPRRT